jgi:mRNA interferase RelE/StbE
VASYRVVIQRSAEKEIAKLPQAIRQRVVDAILSLESDPRPHGSQKLAGEDAYRIREGDYRVVYSIEDEIVTVTIVRVGHRSDVYR